MIQRPDRSECDTFYWTYFDKVPEGDVLATLERGCADMVALLSTVTPERETYAYAPGKWTIRELLGHMIDTDQVFAHRAFWFARGGGELPGMDQDDFAAASNAGERPLADLLDLYHRQRQAHVAMFRGFDTTAQSRQGIASGSPITVRMLVHVLAGHELHHLGVLRERYFDASSA